MDTNCKYSEKNFKGISYINLGMFIWPYVRNSSFKGVGVKDKGIKKRLEEKFRFFPKISKTIRIILMKLNVQCFNKIT